MPHVPIRRRGAVIAQAVVDDEDLPLVESMRWRLDGDGYVVASPRRAVTVRLHRLILGLQKGDGLEVDHINGDKLDNRRCNLRRATRAENGQNVCARGGTSRYRGVHYQGDRGRKKPWRVRILHQGAHHHVGYFATEEDAHKAAQAWYAVNFPFAEADRAVA